MHYIQFYRLRHIPRPSLYRAGWGWVFFLLLITSTDAMAQIAGVACCDWMLLKRQKIGAFQLVRDIRGDGVELDMGPLGRREKFDNRFRTTPGDVAKFKSVADSLGVQVPSVAMSGFFAQSLIDRKYGEFTACDGSKHCPAHTAEQRAANYRALFADCIATAREFGAKVIFLPLGGSGHDWNLSPSAERDTLCQRLRTLGAMAAEAGMTIGIRPSLPVKEAIALLKDINHPAVAIYYNVQDAADRFKKGETGGCKTATALVCRELRTLGARRVCQIHITNTDSVTLRHDPAIDLPAIRKTLSRIGYRGWLVVERSRDARRVRDVSGNFGDNVAYIKEVFGN